MSSKVNVSLVDEACADFTVLYCLIRHNDYLFSAWFDAHHRIKVGCRYPGQHEWEIFQPEGFYVEERQRDATITDYDSHNYLTMAIDGAGYIHLSGNMHVDPLIYFRSERPLDIRSLRCVRNMTGEREKHVTYPLFFKDKDGRLLFRYRDGCSGNGDDIYNSYDTESHKWSRLMDTPLLNGEGERNGYARLPVASTDGYWHMVWMWRESPHCETNNNLSYARSQDLLHWETSDGRPLTLPIDRSHGEVVDNADVHGGLINMVQEVGFDNQGTPLLIYHRYDDNGLSQAYLARPDGQGQWQKSQISQWAFRWDFQGPGSIPPDVRLSAPRAVGNGLLEVEWYARWAGEGIWMIDDNTLEVVHNLPKRVKLEPQYFIPYQHVHPEAEVQIISAQNSDYSHQDKYWLRWESLPICRDISYGSSVSGCKLELLELE